MTEIYKAPSEEIPHNQENIEAQNEQPVEQPAPQPKPVETQIDYSKILNQPAPKPDQESAPGVSPTESADQEQMREEFLDHSVMRVNNVDEIGVAEDLQAKLNGEKPFVPEDLQ